MGGLYAIVFITTVNRRSVPSNPQGVSMSLSEANSFQGTSRTNVAGMSNRGAVPSFQVGVLSTIGETKSMGMGGDVERMDDGIHGYSKR